MARRARVDAELVRRGLARSREHAVELIDARRVKIAGTLATKAATAVEAGTPLGVLGYGQLVWRLQSDDRVHVIDRTNVRSIDAETIGGAVDMIVADLSFISLELVLPAFVACSGPGADMALMVKPQFEVGKDRVGSGGVVRDPELRMSAVVKVASAAAGLGLALQDVTASPLPGPSGNVEYFLWLRSLPGGPDAGTNDGPKDEVERDIPTAVRRAVEEGPQ